MGCMHIVSWLPKGGKDNFESIPGDNVSLQAHVKVQIVDLCMVNSIMAGKEPGGDEADTGWEGGEEGNMPYIRNWHYIYKYIRP
jgi:hypothetical protein